MIYTAACPLPPDPEGYLVKAVPIVGPFTLQRVLLITSATCAGLTTFISYFLIIKHLHRYTEPKQQRQIVRIIFTPVVYATLNCLSIIDYSVSKYMQPLIDLYETFALAALFLLFVEYVAPDEHTRTRFFATLEKHKAKSKFMPSKGYNIVPGGSQVWYERKWFAVFFYIVLDIILTITQEVTQATGDYCITSWRPRFAHVWVVCLEGIFLGWVVLCIINFYLRLKNDPEFAVHKPGLKLVSFKLIVGLNFFQKITFNALNLKTSARVTGYDLKYGIPATVLAGEQVFFAIFFHYAFRSREYHETMKEDLFTPRLGTFRAAANAFNPMDLIRGVLMVPKYAPSLFGRKSSVARTSTYSGHGRVERMTYSHPQNDGRGPTASQPPRYIVTASEETSYSNTYGSLANQRNLAPPQARYSNEATSSVGRVSDDYRSEEEMLRLTNNAR